MKTLLIIFFSLVISLGASAQTKNAHSSSASGAKKPYTSRKMTNGYSNPPERLKRPFKGKENAKQNKARFKYAQKEPFKGSE